MENNLRYAIIQVAINRLAQELGIHKVIYEQNGSVNIEERSANQIRQIYEISLGESISIQ
jgi:hypothetical protein